MAQRQRKGQPAKSGGNTVFYVVLGVIAVGGILAIAYALSGGAGQAVTGPVELDAPDARALYEQATPVRKGEDDAPVKVIEFADYQCPACGTFARSIRPAIERQYVEGGRVQFVYYDYPLISIHDNAFLAARAARCAGDQQLPGGAGENAAYWSYHDKLYEEQGSWSPRSNPSNAFIGYAAEIGLDSRDFERCLRSDRFADVVTANLRLGEQLRITGTPTVLVNNRRVENRTAAIMEAIERALGPAEEPGG